MTASPVQDGVHEFTIQKKVLLDRKYEQHTYQWRAECRCGRNTAWYPTSNEARGAGTMHHRRPDNMAVAS